MSELQLMPIAPGPGLFFEWPCLLSGVMKLLDYAGNETPLERVYNDILHGNCILWKGTVDGRYVGFLTTRVERVPYEAWANPQMPHIQNLIIGQVFIKEGNDPLIFLNGMRQVEDYAKVNNCQQLKFYTMRDKAFERRMRPHGWSPTYTEFVKNIKENQNGEPGTRATGIEHNTVGTAGTRVRAGI